MKKVVIACVFGLFLIPLSYASTFNGPASQASYWSQLKKKAINTRVPRSMVRNVNQITDKVEIKAGERPAMAEKKAEAVRPSLKEKQSRVIDSEEDIKITEVDIINDVELKEDYSDNNLDPSEDTDVDRKYLKKRLEEIRDKIKNLKEEEKVLMKKLENWDKDEREDAKNIFEEKKEEWEERKAENRIEKENFMEKIRETEKNWQEEEEIQDRADFRQESQKEVNVRPEIEEIDREATLEKISGTLLTKVSHPTEEGGSLLVKTLKGALAFQVKGDNWTKFKNGDGVKVVYYPTPTAKNTFKAKQVSYLEVEADDAYEDNMNFRDDREESQDLPEEDVMPMPKPEFYYEKPVLEEKPKITPVIPDFSESLKDLLPPASTLQQSMFQSSSWQKLRERNIEATKKMSRYNKLRSLGGTR